MTWDILFALITIATVLVTLGGVLARLMRTLTKLECAIDGLRGVIEDMKEKSAQTHKRIFSKLEAHENLIACHEMRIHDLENAKGACRHDEGH